MTDRIALVRTFLASLKRSADGKVKPRADLLTDDAVFEALIKLSGRGAVIERMSGDTTGRVYREVTWGEPEKYGEALKIIGKTPPGSLVGGVALVFHFAGDKISVIQHQPIPGAPMPATELKLSPELKVLVNNALVTRHPMLMAYVNDSGQPVLSFRGSTQTFSDDQLAVWVRNADGNLLKSVAKNPKVAFMYRNEDTKETFQFQGRAWVATGEAERRKVYDNAPPVERAHDFARTGVALIVDLDLVEGWFGLTPDGPIGRVRMLRGAGKR
jgi:Pyridoxamine 5'-phosphate oxidase